MGTKHSQHSVSKALPEKGVEVSYNLNYPVNRGTNMFITYINLDRRTDRRQDIERELQRMNIGPFHRFAAIQNPVGLVGCAQSHISCIKQGLRAGADHIMVFEDDFYFTVDSSLMHTLLQQVMQTDYDVFLLGYCVQDSQVNICNTRQPLFKKINQALCAHGYVVSKEYAPKLLKNFEQGLQLLLLHKDQETSYAIDQYWKLLQDDDMWLCYAKGPCGLQRGGFSDITQKVKPGSITDIKSNC